MTKNEISEALQEHLREEFTNLHFEENVCCEPNPTAKDTIELGIYIKLEVLAYQVARTEYLFAIRITDDLQIDMVSAGKCVTIDLQDPSSIDQLHNEIRCLAKKTASNIS